jgi:hypothetical protein
LLAHHWLGAADEDKAVRYLTLAGDRARQEYALDEAVAYYRELLPLLERRGEEQEIALGLFKLALALHMALRFSEADATYQRAFEHWTPPARVETNATLRIASSFLPNDPDPRSAIAWPRERSRKLSTTGSSSSGRMHHRAVLAERWDISADGRYAFHLRKGLRWSDGTPHGRRRRVRHQRVLDPDAPIAAVAVYLALEHGRAVRLPDEDTSEKARWTIARWGSAGAFPPYFMSVMNRPDGAAPSHAIDGNDADGRSPDCSRPPFRMNAIRPARVAAP